MKVALVTPFTTHLPLYPSAYLGYGIASLREMCDLDVIDFNAEIYQENRIKLREILSTFENQDILIDSLGFYPLYYHLLDSVEIGYQRVSWGEYESTFITIPSWFVTVPTDAVLKIANQIRKKSTDTEVYFFGNSLGSWTDENELRNNKIHVRHLNHLFQSNGSGEPVNYDSLPTPVYENRYKYLFDMLPFRLKHGCIWGGCRFCSLAKGWNSGYLERDPKKVVREIRELIDKYDPKMFACTDNSINGDNLLEFCEYFKDFKKPWAGMARADLSRKEISGLQNAGCKLIYFGLESGSDRVLNEINKGITSKQLSMFIGNLDDHNIMPYPSVFVGSPSETEDDFRKTIQFLLAHRRYFEVINVFPFLITPASDFCLENKRPHEHALKRLNELIRVCKDAGIKVCVGEQSGEYAICKTIFPGHRNY
ncbi:MAG: radical SAM protein [Proteobacteria bacterium]|nr:radical SAM protein [Pseudomonadota bacterium]NIS60168.1 radical SAM protein [Pseudomonadota bacterium]